MMNFLALGLVLTSLVTAGFLTPSPQTPNKDSVIVKEGHRVVVVEYEKDDGNTKVSISPQDSQAFQTVDGKGSVATANDKLSEKLEGVKEGVKGAASSAFDELGDKAEEVQQKFRPRELVCDAYGKCKHKIASAFGKTTETVAEKVYEAEEAVSDAAGKVKDTFTHTAHKASDKVQEAKENVKDSASKAKEKANGIKDEAARKMEGAKKMVSEKAKAAGQAAEKASDRAKKGASRVKKEGQKELGEILQHARELAVDAFDYVLPPERVAPVAGVLHLMGFAAAYGMCLWVTFVSSYVLARVLPRQQFAMVQSKIYPVYFKAMGYCVGMALLGHLMGPSRRSLPASAVVFQGFNLASALAMILTNLLWLEPRATKVMLERLKKEKEEGNGKEGHTTTTTTTIRSTTTESSVRAVDSTAETAGRGPTSEAAVARSQIIQLSQTLQKLNSYSSFLNASTLVLLTWHLVHLGQCLHTKC